MKSANKPVLKIVLVLSSLLITAIACRTLTTEPISPTPTATVPSPTPAPPTQTPTPLPPAPVQPGPENPDEPVFISGDIPYTSPFFIFSLAEPFVLLEDQAGFVNRDLEFTFPLSGQMIGPVEVIDDKVLRYTLPLPAVPQGTLVDVDNNGETDTGVQVFAVAFWSNTWGGPFLEERDGQGWSGGYVSTVVNSERHGEIEGGILIVWAPDDKQSFPIGFGEDQELFTEDDPSAPIPAGYNIVNLDEEPFRFYKEAQPEITLNEGAGAVNDYSELSYSEAFDAMFAKVSKEYPFTKDKNINWDALYAKIKPEVENAKNADAFYFALNDFAQSIPDGHIGISFSSEETPDFYLEYFFSNYQGSFGLQLAELSTGQVIVTRVYPNTPGERNGFKVGAEILEWDGKSVADAIAAVHPFFGPYSTEHHTRLNQLLFLTRFPRRTEVEVVFKNPDDTEPQTVKMDAEFELDSLFDVLFYQDEMALPIETEILDPSGLGYIRINTFLDDFNLMARLWERAIEKFIELETPGIIIDIRDNGGGSGGLAGDFAGYFFDKETLISQNAYYNDLSGEFEYLDVPRSILPGPMLYEGLLAVLVSPNCASACEGFAYMLRQSSKTTIIGHYPTAGMYGEVGQGQYDLPEEISMQFPTGRPETPDGTLLIEGTGVVPDIIVPVTTESALQEKDALLEAAIDTLLDKLP